MADEKGKDSSLQSESEKTKIGRSASPSAKKEKRVRWITRAMAEDFTRRDVLRTTVRDFTLFVIFLIAVSMCTIGGVSRTVYYLNEAMENQFIKREFETVNRVGITFDAIRSAADFWFYLETLFLDSLYWESYYSEKDFITKAPDDDQKLLFENLILGVPRIRQVRVKKNFCEVHRYFKKTALRCYDLFSESGEDRSPFGLRNGTAWTYTPGEITEAESYTGKLSFYSGGGFHQDLRRIRRETAKIIAGLKENLWTDRQTRAVIIDFSLYNANIDIFIVCKLIFEFPPTGGVIPNHRFLPLKLFSFNSERAIINFVFECIVYVIAGFFLVEKLREIMYFKFRYFLLFWSYVDVAIVTLAMVNLLLSIIIFPTVEPTLERIVKAPYSYANLEFLASSKKLYINISAILLFFSFIKLFKYLNFNRTMGQLNSTLRNCALDIVGFSIMFFVIFFAFAELGYCLFGSQVENFSTFTESMFSLLRTILGDFNYQQIERANRVLAPVYFLTYIFFVFFVLLNMFLAIINDTYADVKTEIAITPEVMPMSEFLTREMYKLLQKMGFDVKYRQEKAKFNTTVAQIREALKNCGFTDLEIEMFFARYNIDPHVVVSDFNIKKIMKDLEAEQLIAGKEGVDQDTTVVHVSDFIMQQERLEQIELTIELISFEVEKLKKKLEAYDHVRKI